LRCSTPTPSASWPRGAPHAGPDTSGWSTPDSSAVAGRREHHGAGGFGIGGSIASWPTPIFVVGLLFTGVLVARNVRAAILIGMLGQHGALWCADEVERRKCMLTCMHANDG
jgi:hypothetical protein